MDENNEIEQELSEGQENSPSTPVDEAAENPEVAADAESLPDTPDGSALESETPESSENVEAGDSESPIIDDKPDDGIVEPLAQEDIDKALKQSAQVTDKFGPGGADSDKGPAVRHADFQQLSSSADTGETKNIELLMDVDLPVSIELGRTKMRISDILNLAPGSIVELDKLVGEPVDLLVNRKCVARGEVVVVEESFGLRITQLVSPEERLRNLQ